METYVGTKIVQAEPMTQGQFETSRGTGWPQGAADPVGYKVVYEDGYESWSPKEVFERCYRKITVSEKALVF